LLPGGANQFPGGLLPLWTTAFHGAPGYSTSIREKYQAYLLNEVTLEISGQTLKPGAYGFGFLGDAKFVVMDIGANDVLNGTSQRDAELKRPVPLQVIASSTAGSYRMYAGRDYFEFRRAH
jgi:hypothetical protein